MIILQKPEKHAAVIVLKGQIIQAILNNRVIEINTETETVHEYVREEIKGSKKAKSSPKLKVTP